MQQAFEPLSEKDDEAARRSKAPNAEDKWHPVMPVPEGAPEPSFAHRELGEPVARWEYRDQENRRLGFVCRFETPAGKQYRPRTLWERPGGTRAWRWKGFPSPRPLYGLDRLAPRPSAPVLLVEGEKKADAAQKLFPGYVALGWPGGANGVEALDPTPLRGRSVRLWPDADEPGHQAAKGMITKLLDAGAAEARVVPVPESFPPAWDLADPPPPGWTSADLQRLLDEAEPFRHQQATRVGPYESGPDGFLRWKATKDGEVSIPITNFTARIVQDVTYDDGAERSRLFEVEIHFRGRRRLVKVSACDFDGLGWVIRELGVGPLVLPGFGTKDHVRAAIQMFSDGVVRETVYQHTGWTRFGGQWVYLHAKGAIGAGGAIEGLRTDLEACGLGNFELELPAAPAETVEAIRASLKLLDVAPLHITAAIFCTLWRAPLGPTDFTLFLVGRTGRGKTELLTLTQQHFGAAMHARNLPADWSSTANALEVRAFAAKDAVLLIDDFAPTGSAQDIAKLHREAARLIRAQGNRSGRGRLRPDAALRATKPPRGTIAGTGEDVPRGHSVRSRLVILELGPKDVDFAALGEAQRLAARGMLARSMGAYVRWLSGRYDKLREQLPDLAARFRNDASQTGQHRRTPANIGEMATGLHTWLQFAKESGALSAGEAEELWTRLWDALIGVSIKQDEHHSTSDPVERFRALLRSALASGEAHVANGEGNAPQEKEAAWGWRRDGAFTGDTSTFRPQGARIGWIEGDNLYLDSGAALKVADRMTADGEKIPFPDRTLAKRLDEGGHLASIDEKRERLHIRRTLEGERRPVLHVKTSFVYPD